MMLPYTPNKTNAPSIAIQLEKIAPAVSLCLCMPFEPKMIAKAEIIYKLEALVHKAEIKLRKSYPASTVEPILLQIKAVVKHLDYNTHKKSIAIYISAKAEKIFYLDISLDEKVIIDHCFNIRSLVESKKNEQHYMLLALGSTMSKVYFGNGDHLTSMLTKTRKSSPLAEGNVINSYNNPVDASSVESFFEQTDNNLTVILSFFSSLPLFIVGSASTLNEYKTVTKNEMHITQLIEDCCDTIAIDEIKALLQPYIQNWEHVRMKHLHRQLDNAMDSGKIAVGIDNVAKAANQRRAKLLILEKDYTFPVVKAVNKNLKNEEHLSPGNSHLTDVVDEVIERVISSGGDVEFADHEVLTNYKHIALIYY